MFRLVDLFAVLAVAVVVLLPKPSVSAKPALEGEPVELDRVAQLQTDAFAHPTDLAPALQLADELMSYARADWALQTLAPYVEREVNGQAPRDARLHLAVATAHAERFESHAAVDEQRIVEEICHGVEGTPQCPPGTLARSQIIGGAMKVLADKDIDPSKEPVRAKAEVYKAIHPSRSNFKVHAGH